VRPLNESARSGCAIATAYVVVIASPDGEAS